MARNRFDQACRYAAKLDPPGFLSWLLELPATGLGFTDWLDTRTLPFPGDPERTCDTVACLNLQKEDWALVIEFCLTADASMFGRLLVYLGQLWLENRPSPQRRFRVGAAVVNLTGSGQASRDMRLASARTCLQVVERNLAHEDAATTLARIAAIALGAADASGRRIWYPGAVAGAGASRARLPPSGRLRRTGSGLCGGRRPPAHLEGCTEGVEHG